MTCVAAAPLRPSLVVSGSSDCTLIMWDMATGSEGLSFRGHTDTVQCAALAPDASALLSGKNEDINAVVCRCNSKILRMAANNIF